MKKYKVFLSAESEEGRESFCTVAERSCGKNGDEFVFSGRDGQYRILLGERVVISRTGELAYRLTLDASEQTQAVLQTAFGEIPVGVRAERLSVRSRGESFFLKAEYILSFPDFTQKHKIVFTAKE